MDAVRKLILEKLVEAGLTMSEASVKIGRNHAYLQQFLKRGIPAQLGERERAALAALLKVQENQLRGTSEPLPAREYVKLNIPVPESEQVVTKSDTRHNLVDMFSPIPPVLGGADLPVFGTAQGGRGALIVTDRPVAYVVRPAPLLNVVDGYGMIVSGHSMAPKLENGDTVLLNPFAGHGAGDTCLFRSHADDGTVHAIVKELRSETDKEWRVRQYTPKRDYSLKKAEWQVCHKVVAVYFA